MNPISEEKLRLCVRSVHDLQKHTACERAGVDTSEKDGNVIVRFPLELQSGENAPFTMIMGEHFSQIYCELQAKLDIQFRLPAALVGNAVNQALRFGHIAVDSRDGRVFYTLSQLAESEQTVPGTIAVAVMEMNDWFSPVLDFLTSPMERQDLDDFMETADRIAHLGPNTIPTDELYPEEE